MMNITNTYLHCLNTLEDNYSDNLINGTRPTLSKKTFFQLHIADYTSGVLYASAMLRGERGFALLEKAVESLLAAADVVPLPQVLWSARYQQQPSSGHDPLPSETQNVIRFPPPSMDLAFDDTILDNVKDVWQKIMGEGSGEFLVFQDREAYADDE